MIFIIIFAFIAFVLFFGIRLINKAVGKEYVEIEKPIMIKCPACHNNVSRIAENCPICGHKINQNEELSRIAEVLEKKEEKKFGRCNYCGGKIADIATICPHCGAPTGK